MPSKSKAQAKLMAAVAHNPSFAKKVGIPTSVGKDFNQADKGKKFKGGGNMAKANLKALFGGKETKAEEAKEKKAVGKKGYAAAEKKFEGEKLTVGGKVPKASDMGDLGMKCGGKVKKYARGGGIEVRGKTKGRMV